MSSIVFDNRRNGRRLYVRLARTIDQQRRDLDLLHRTIEATRNLVALSADESRYAEIEPLSEQERRILKLFAEGSNAKTIPARWAFPP